MLVTFKVLAGSHANLYLKFAQALQPMHCLGYRLSKRVLALKFATVKTRPGLNFLSHLPTSNFTVSVHLCF